MPRMARGTNETSEHQPVTLNCLLRCNAACNLRLQGPSVICFWLPCRPCAVLRRGSSGGTESMGRQAGWGDEIMVSVRAKKGEEERH
jgi:hypothetical protein